ncbi:MAG: hypothetical protein ACFE91_05955 [Promethearchaeota archaeon]
MERERLKRILLYSILVIMSFSIVILVLNVNFISVIYSWSDSLPVLTTKTYSAIEVSLLFVIIILTIVNALSISFDTLKPVKPYIISFTPFISVILLILLIFNPHAIAINPKNRPPVQLDNIEIGGIFFMILSISFTACTFTLLYLEGYMKPYFLSICLVIGALLLSDFIHEGGHALIAIFSGGKVIEFYPFPVLLGGEFTAGYVGFSDVPTNLVPLVILGGEIFQWISIGLILTFLYFKPKYRKNIFILALLLIAFLDFPLYVINNLIGLPHWFFLGSTNGDLMIFSTLTGFPLWALFILALVQLLFFVVIFYFLIFRNWKKLTTEDSTIIN